MNSKRGSSAVFLSVILAALMTITLALIYGVREETIRSRTDSIVNLAGDSILSEFDSYVQEEYGLFLIRGNDQELSGKLKKIYLVYDRQHGGYGCAESFCFSREIPAGRYGSGKRADPGACPFRSDAKASEQGAFCGICWR